MHTACQERLVGAILLHHHHKILQPQNAGSYSKDLTDAEEGGGSAPDAPPANRVSAAPPQLISAGAPRTPVSIHTSHHVLSHHIFKTQNVVHPLRFEVK